MPMLPCRAAFRCLQALAVAPLVIPVAGIPSKVTVEGRRLLVNGVPVHLKGVNWNPVPRGLRGPRGLHFRESVDKDAGMMAEIGVNAVRTYEPITDRYVLDTLWRHGIWVANTVYSWGGHNPSKAAEAVLAAKDHPAILMWVIGNEWNYNKLYFQGFSDNDVVSRIREACRIIKENDRSHLVATVYGHLPDAEVLRNLPEIDVWGLNVYSGISLGSIFDEWKARSQKPMFLGEYGADAYNTNIHAEDEDSQAKATTMLTQEIMAHSSVANPEGTCVGGFIFEFADEWWKDARGSDSEQDVGGIAPGQGPYPDMTFNEEYWGLVREDRTPRSAYFAYGKVGLPSVGTEPVQACSIQRGYDYNGDDLRWVGDVQSAEDCAALCSADAVCRSFTYVKKAGHAVEKTCFLKKSLRPNPRPSDCCDSGLPCPKASVAAARAA
mmetsp:Transcript_100100/g.278913  ORF Transcript_100100/g.278913 Transcript_100100/m.278913 type:complete len:437 (+) Transcript_100100:45-1355(+)